TPGWWEWKPAKRALEFLYLRGDLMVSARRNFHRLYDLTERVLPEQVDTTMPTVEECAAKQIQRALQAFGLVREVEIAQYLKIADRKAIQSVLEDMVNSGKILTVRIRGIEGELYYTTPDQLAALSNCRIPKKVYLLSPFDNLVIQRDRMKLLFGFDYTIECYVPAPKRKYGYFVCPILWGSEMVARIDMKADRQKKTLLVQSLHYEPGLKSIPAFEKALGNALEQFAVFNGCESIWY
ncbi:MAG: winged helix DNA-binding domain-containing protein, partial [Verrucomicrobiae bacterium]|nr:winged helix DNA-binding domain-containing protein [Verrucomicrobiae bacterium]